MSTVRAAICVKNEGYEASLRLRKVYDLLTDEEAESRGYLRVVDESGDDYLFPSEFFMPVDLPAPIDSDLKRRN